MVKPLTFAAIFPGRQQRMDTTLQLLRVLTVKNIRVRYKNSVLGWVWSLLNPLLFLLIFSFIFSRAFVQIENYPLYVISGLIFWNFFATAIPQIIQSLPENAGVIRSLRVDSKVFPLSHLLSALVHLAIALIPFGGLMFFFGMSLSIKLVLLIPAMILLASFTLGLGLLLCTLNVFFRDVNMLWLALSPAWFYFTPIAYPIELIPERWRWVTALNPLYNYFEIFRGALYYDAWPSLKIWLLATAFSVALLGLGWWVFVSFRRGFISNI